MCKKILFINRSQFGYLTDTYKYCQYLRSEYELHYVCFNTNLPKVELENIKITYIPNISPRFVRGMLYIMVCIFKCLFFNGLIFVVYFPKCYILKKLLFWKKMHIDIRSLSISPNNKVRIKGDMDIQKTVNLYNSCSFISKGVRDKLKISINKKTNIIPLGSDIISTTIKEYEHIRLLYVGTLNNRDIIETVKGLKIYLDKNPQAYITYDIVGDGDEYCQIDEYIKVHKLDRFVHLHGIIPYPQLKPFFDSHNVGVSYIPITEYFEFQPPTKTFEYILSGLYCIATNTFSNKEIINDHNGILINDNPQDFSSALAYIEKNKSTFNNSEIRNTLLSYTWEKIVNDNLKPFIKQIYK